MPTFVDFAGMNTLVSSSFDNTNTIASEKNGEYTAESIPDHQELVGINLHRNGPYGYSTWKQLRVSENPLTRHHRETNKMTFVIQPGPVTNVLSNGELRVRSRYSSIYSFTEPAIAQKSYPLVWNVGRHFKDEDGNLAPDPQRFSIISSYGNSQIGFANKEVDDLLKFKSNEEKTEYNTIKAMYLENGLNKQDSPLTHWEFIQYRETVFPKSENQYIDKVRNRPQFESVYRHSRGDRTKIIDIGESRFNPDNLFYDWSVSQSNWSLDESENFLTRTFTNDTGSIYWMESDSMRQRHGEGVLFNTYTQFYSRLDTLVPFDASNLNAYAINTVLGVGPLYSRRISLSSSTSVSNPSGLEIYNTGSTGIIARFMGGALWETPRTRQVKDENGVYQFSPRYPFYDSYSDYAEELRRYAKNYAIIPEFRMSTQIEDYKKTDNAIELDMFEVTGGISGSENSSKESFYTIYSNSDFLRSFEIIEKDHKDFTNGKVLSMRCKAVKKFLPYDGFYPAQRTVDLANRFFESYQKNIAFSNLDTILTSSLNFMKQSVVSPLFAPGVLMNTIKSGVAVDYPIITGSLNVTSGYGGEATIAQDFDKRIPFEALINPKRYLANVKLTSNEPSEYGNLSASAEWDGEGDEFYTLMANNFLGEVPEFFLPNGQLTSVVSKKQQDIGILESGKVYGMRIKMRRSMDKKRPSVYHYDSASYPYSPPQDIILTGSSACKETFTMYSRPSAFGPPSYGATANGGGIDKTWRFENDTDRYSLGGTAFRTVIQDSRHGFNYPFTPPYYHGEAWCDIWITGSGQKLTIEQIQRAVSSSFSRFDTSYLESSASFGNSYGPQAWHNINKNAVQLSASLNLFGVGKVESRTGGATAGSLVVDTAVDEESRWVIQTKFETPMLNFNHISGSDFLTLPQYGSESVPRGMWHQYGRIPEENEGVFINVEPIPDNYQIAVMNKAAGSSATADMIMLDLSEFLGFSGIGTKIGKIASSKTISEAVVAVPFVENEGRKKFFKLAITEEQIRKYKRGAIEQLITGDPEVQIGRSVLLQMDKMKKFIFPPSFDFLNFSDVDPIAMYVFEFSHTLSQQDLSDIWQNLSPDIGQSMETAEVAITHPLLKKELLGQGGESGNTLINMPDKLKWMVFKVKQRASSNYLKKTVLRNPAINARVESKNVTQDEFGPTTAIQYNWPYDFFSLVEMVKLDAEVEFGNFDKEAIKNYTDSIPDWNAKQADMDKIEHVVGGLEDDPIPDVQVPQISGVFAGKNIGGQKTLSNQTSVMAGNVNISSPQTQTGPSIQAQRDDLLERMRLYFVNYYNNEEKKLLVGKAKAYDRAMTALINHYASEPISQLFGPNETIYSVAGANTSNWARQYTNYYD